MIDSAFIARLGRDAELRHVRAGSLAMLSFSAAVETRATTTDGEGKDETQWIRVVYFGSVAETLAPRLPKGERVYVEGRLKLDHWTSQDGAERTGLNVVATLVQPLGQIGRRHPKKPQAAKAGPPGTDVPAPAANSEDGVPFNGDIGF